LESDEEGQPTESDREDRVRAAMAEFFKRTDQTQRPFPFAPPQSHPVSGNPSNLSTPQAPSPSGVSVSRNEELAPGPIAPASPSENPKSEIRNPKFLALPPVVQIHNTYLVCQTDDGLVIVDQHALHERIIYQTLLARTSNPDSSLQSQRMLIPQHVTLGARHAALLFDHEELLSRLGLELTRFGRDDVAICAFPTLLERIDPGAFLRDLADKLADEPPATPEEFLHGVLDMMACKAAVKAGDPLTPSEIDALLAQRDLVERSSNCPHGRPTALTFSLAELEKQFHRR
jgi:DNA mismatch repair protein MutL